jgi:hypothetical protein
LSFLKKGGGDTPRKRRFISVEITKKLQNIIELIIPKFIEGSACFERHTALHQELQFYLQPLVYIPMW